MNTKKLEPEDLLDANHLALTKPENNSYSKTESSIFQREVN